MPAPSSPEMGVQSPQVLSPQQEVISQPASVEVTRERPAAQELQPAASQAVPVLPVPVPRPSAAPAAPLAPPLHPLAAGDANPTVASDEEVIEKEWVDKAKKIITQTKNDPYMQEKEVSKLQADYLKKRYGKDIKVVED